MANFFDDAPQGNFFDDAPAAPASTAGNFFDDPTEMQQASAKPGMFDGFVKTMSGIGDVITGREGKRQRLWQKAGGSVMDKDKSARELQTMIDLQQNTAAPQPMQSMTQGPENPQTFMPPTELGMNSSPAQVLDVTSRVLQEVPGALGQSGARAKFGVERMINDATKKFYGVEGPNFTDADIQRREGEVDRRWVKDTASLTPGQQTSANLVAGGAEQAGLTALSLGANLPATVGGKIAQLAGTMALPSTAKAYDQLSRAGLSGGTLVGGAISQGLADAVPEAIPMGVLAQGALPTWKAVRTGLAAADVKPLVQMLKYHGMGAAAETLQEYPSTAWNWINDYLTGDPTATLDRLGRDLVETTTNLPLQIATQNALMHGGRGAVRMAGGAMDRMDPMGALAEVINSEFAAPSTADVAEVHRATGHAIDTVAQPAPNIQWPEGMQQPAHAAGMPIEPMQVGEGGRRGMPIVPVESHGVTDWETIPDDVLERVAPKGYTAQDMREIGAKILASADSGGLIGSDWYTKAANYVLGMFNGDREQAEQFIKVLAITSPIAEVSSNTTLSTKAWDAFTSGQPIPTLGMEKTRQVTDQLYFGKDWSGLKTNTFYRNLHEAMMGTDKGGFSTQDLHMANLVFGVDKPSPTQYRALEEATRLAASVRGVIPRDLQAAAWVPQKAKSMAAYYRERGWNKAMSDEQLLDYTFEMALRDYSYYLSKKGYTPKASQATPDQRRAAVTTVTAEAVPSPATPEGTAIMALPVAERAAFNKAMGKAIDLKALAEVAGINAEVRVESGHGGYMQGVQPNLIIEIVPRSGNAADIDKAAIERFALAWMYAYKQNSVPFFRASPDLMNKPDTDIGVRFTFPNNPTQKRMEGLMKSINEAMGEDAGFTDVDGEIYMINFPFLGKTPDQFLDEAEKVAQNYGATLHAFGTDSEYPDEHDWQADPSGSNLIARIEALAGGRGDLQARLDRLAAPGRAIIEQYAGQGKGLPLQEVNQTGEFPAESGTLGIPRSEMPQIKVMMRPAFVKAMERAGVTRETVPAASLKPTQKDYDTDKSDRAAGLSDDASDKSAVIVSNDGYILDGHHRWMAKAQAGKPINIIKVDLPIRQLLGVARNFANANQHLAKRENYPVMQTATFMPEPVLRKARKFIEELPSEVPKKEFPDEDMERANKMAVPLVEAAAKHNAAFIDRVFDIGEASGALGVMIGPIKKPGRVADKLVDPFEAGWNPDKIRDIIRATVVIGSYAEAQGVLDEIGRRFEVVPGRVKNRTNEAISHPDNDDKGPLDSGYMDVLVNVMINGVQAEIQINVPEMIGAKLAEGHKLYEIERNLPEGHGMKKSVVAAQLEFYGAAFDAAARRASSDDRIGSDRGRVPSINSPERSSSANALPSGNTTIWVPGSDSKNLQPGGNTAGTFISTPPSDIVPQPGKGMPIGPVEARMASDADVAWFNEVESNLREEDGSPMRLYHGTTKTFQTFKPSKTGAMGGPAVYLGDNPETGSHYAGDGEGARVVPVFARGKYLSNAEWSELVGKHGWAGAREEAQRQGYAGVWDKKFESAVAVWDPANIRSAVAIEQRQDASEDLSNQSAWLTDQATKRGFDSIDQMLAEDVPGFFSLAEEWRNGHPADVLQIDGLYGPYAIQPTMGGEVVEDRARVPKIGEASMARRQIEPLTAPQFGTVNAALSDLASAGLPTSWMNGVTYYGLKPVGAGYANYNPEDGAIAVEWTWLDKAKKDTKAQINIRGWLAHELHHRIDNYRNSTTTMFYLSAESPRMDITITPAGRVTADGDLMNEAYSLWQDGGALTQYLNYPFQTGIQIADDPGRGVDYATQFVKIETFAQMGALWTTNPQLVQDVAPKWAQFFKEWQDARGKGTVEQSRLSLRALLHKADNQANVDGPVGRQDQRAADSGQDQRSLAVAAAGPGVGAVRTAGRKSGGQARLSTPEEQARASGFLVYPTAPVPAETKVGKLNYDVLLPEKDYRTINSPDELKATLSRLTELHAAEIEKQRRGVVGHEQTYKEAEAIYSNLTGVGGKTIRSLMQRTPGTAAGAGELIARRDLMMTATDDLRRQRDALADKKRKGQSVSPEEHANFIAAMERGGMVIAMFMGARAEAGRALEILKETKRMTLRAQAIQELITQYNGPESLDQIVDMMEDIDNPAQLLAAGLAATNPTIMDALIELWKNGLLSGPTTHLANILGNTTYMALRIPQTAIAGIFGKTHWGTKDKVYFGEAFAQAYGIYAGTIDALRAAGEVFRDPSKNPHTKLDNPHPEAFTGRTFHAKGRLGRSIDMVGHGIRVPYRMLGTADAFFRSMNGSMSIHAGAVRQTLMEGKHYWQKDFMHRVAQLASEARMAILVPGSQVSKEAQAIADEALEDAEKYTFNEKGGVIVKNLLQLRRDVKALSFIMPFISTPAAILRKSLEMTPAAPISAQWRKEVAAGGHRRDTAFAQVATGAAIALMVMSWANIGMITGGGSPEPEARRRRREAGIPDYSIKLWGKWHEYRRLEPLGTLMGMAADAAEVHDYAMNEQGAHLSRMVAMAFAQAVTSKTFWKGMSDLANVFSDPGRYGEGYIQSYAGSLVPGIIAQTASHNDRIVRDRGIYGMDDAAFWEKEAQLVINAVKARIPKTSLNPEFNSESLPAKKDTWGEDVKSDERLFPFAPIRTGKTTDDPVRLEAYNSRAKLGMPAKEIDGVKLDPDTYWTQYAGPAGQYAHKMMSKVVESPQWKQAPPFLKQEIFEDLVKMGRELSADVLKARRPEIEAKAMDKLKEQINAEPNQPRAR